MAERRFTRVLWRLGRALERATSTVTPGTGLFSSTDGSFNSLALRKFARHELAAGKSIAISKLGLPAVAPPCDKTVSPAMAMAWSYVPDICHSCYGVSLTALYDAEHKAGSASKLLLSMIPDGDRAIGWRDIELSIASYCNKAVDPAALEMPWASIALLSDVALEACCGYPCTARAAVDTVIPGKTIRARQMAPSRGSGVYTVTDNGYYSLFSGYVALSAFDFSGIGDVLTAPARELLSLVRQRCAKSNRLPDGVTKETFASTSIDQLASCLSYTMPIHQICRETGWVTEIGWSSSKGWNGARGLGQALGEVLQNPAASYNQLNMLSNLPAAKQALGSWLSSIQSIMGASATTLLRMPTTKNSSLARNANEVLYASFPGIAGSGQSASIVCDVLRCQAKYMYALRVATCPANRAKMLNTTVASHLKAPVRFWDFLATALAALPEFTAAPKTSKLALNCQGDLIFSRSTYGADKGDKRLAQVIMAGIAAGGCAQLYYGGAPLPLITSSGVNLKWDAWTGNFYSAAQICSSNVCSKAPNDGLFHPGFWHRG